MHLSGNDFKPGANSDSLSLAKQQVGTVRWEVQLIHQLLDLLILRSILASNPTLG